MKYAPETTIDGYKTSHRPMYHPDVTLVGSNATPRKSYRLSSDKVVAVGSQYVCKHFFQDIWNKEFFQQPWKVVKKRFQRRMGNYLFLDKATVEVDHLKALHDLGFLPLKMYALPEGVSVDYKVPTFVYHNTKPTEDNFFWLTNYLETAISCLYWPLTTSATTANQMRKLLTKYAEATGNVEFVPFQGHNFSARGCMGLEAAAMVDFGHLSSFVGTDTMWGIDFAEEFYNADSDEELVGCSVPASEHSVCSSWGPVDEREMVRYLIQDKFPSGIISLVSDTYDYFNMITNIAPSLKDVIEAREGAPINKVVFRPDSGDNVKVITGYFEDEIIRGIDGKIYERINYDNGEGFKDGRELSEAEVRGTIGVLYDNFGGSENDKGYLELNPKVGCILGDGVTLKVAEDILTRLKKKGFASTNLVLGIGSFTYQMVTRDTDGWAVKATFCVKGGELSPIFKDPKTDTTGMKKSAKGITAVYLGDNGEYYLKDEATWEELENCALELIFENGVLLKETTLGEIRERIVSGAGYPTV